MESERTQENLERRLLALKFPKAPVSKKKGGKYIKRKKNKKKYTKNKI